jgi:uncharacterized protein YegL
MEPIKHDMEGGIATFIKEQQAIQGECTFSFVQFDTEYDVINWFTPLADVQEIELVPRGGTALLDAIGTTVIRTGEHLAAMDEMDRPENVLIVIVTDGEENSSKDWMNSTIKDLITQQQTKYNWTFVC